MATAELSDTLPEETLQIGNKTLRSRLIVGTGRYDSMEVMRDSHEQSGSDCLTVAVRRERLYNCLLYTSPSPRDQRGSRMPSSA